MSEMPETGSPDDEMPEATDRDLALAQRRDGRPVDAVASGRQHLADAIRDLEAARKDAAVDHALTRMRDALEALEPAGR